jgi:type IV pilus assembly protein PilF
MNIKKIMNKLVLLFLVVLLASCSSQPQKQGQSQEQGPDLKEASKLNVQLAVGYIKRDELDIARGKLEKAIEQDDTNSDAYKTLGYLYSRLGMNKEASDAYEKAIGIKSNDPDLHNNYGAFLCKMGKLDEALKEFKIAYTSPFYESPYLAYANAGTCLSKQGNYLQAETMLRKALYSDPNLPGALISMADLGIKTKRYLMARAYIERYHAHNNPSPDSLWIAVQAEKGLGDRGHYLKYANQLISQFPNSDEASWARDQERDEQLRNK